MKIQIKTKTIQILILLLSLFLFSNGIFAEKGRCGFIGIFKNIKINKKNMKCSVEKAGNKRYLIYSIYKLGGYLIDISNIKDEGSTNVYIKAMGPGGFKGPNKKTYTATVRARVNKIHKMKNGRYIKVNTFLKSKSGHKIKFKGSIVFTTQEKPKIFTGNLSYNFMGHTIQPKKDITLKPWNDGYSLSYMHIIKPGNTMTLTVNIPKKRTGIYTDKSNAQITVMAFSYVNGKMSSKMFMTGNYTVKVKIKKGRATVNFSGILKTSKGKKQKISGRFIGSLSD